MFFNNASKKSVSDGQIKVTRDSVCMGDDVTAPNTEFLDMHKKDMLSDALKKVEKYLPQMSDSVWSVESRGKVLAYIVMDEYKKTVCELCHPDTLFSEMKVRSLHCSYFPHKAKTFIEEGRRCMGERFAEELLIEKGSIQLWGEWFGRPYDIVHTIESVKWSSTEIVIHFDKGETLYITDPVEIINEKNQLIIGDASKVLFVWYEYGKEQTYDNLYVRQYIKNNDGKILRAKGKRRDIGSSVGYPFQTGENAVRIIA
ncbi:MAG: hypothetical protein J1E40_12825 [Oscillospiraceae bacterium]|nr:hypothetical protein [Oscillospiraceae bacterium]